MTSKFPKYIVRPDDFMIFSLNDDGKTYTPDDSKSEFPDSMHNKYTFEQLMYHKFIIILESQYDEYKKKHDEIYKNIKTKTEH